MEEFKTTNGYQFIRMRPMTIEETKKFKVLAREKGVNIAKLYHDALLKGLEAMQEAPCQG